MGAVSVIAKFTLPGEDSQVAARLLDIGPDGKATLVNRGLWRPATGGPTKQVFQLHPNGYKFEEGHVAKLELLAADAGPAGSPALANYGRPSNNQQPVTVSKLEMRLPTVEEPGDPRGFVGAPSPKFVPAGYDLAADFAALKFPKPKLAKKLKLKGKKVKGKVACPPAFAACNDGKVVLTANVKSKGKGGKGGKARKREVKVASGKFSKKINGGKSKNVKLKLTGKGRKIWRRSRS